MTPRGRPVDEDDLHARIDGQLPRERIEDVEAHLAAHPEVEARFSDYAAQRQALRAAFAEQAGGPILARLRVANLLERRQHGRYRLLTQIAAAVGLIVLGGIGGWAVRDLTGPLSSLPPGAVAA
jgi:anti-sigma factor RsiW